MKVALEKNIETPHLSFTVQHLNDPFFDPNWHFHPHYQLFTVLEGTGTRLIGDSIENFSPGDTVFLGPNVPHLWRSDKKYFDTQSKLLTKGIVVYFTSEFLGTFLENKPETKGIKKLLSQSSRGLYYKGATQQFFTRELQKIGSLKGFDRVLCLLQILNELSKSDDFEFITSINYRNSHKLSETKRMQKVYDYVLENLKNPIKLEDVADLAAMSPSAFCRYFKKRANKTFFDFLTEMRIGHACKLLSESEGSVHQICYESGYQTLSNFNRAFKKVVHKTPTEYLKEIK